MATALSPEEVNARLAALPHWHHHPPYITRTFRFARYPQAVAFAVEVALHAERVDHHPELVIGYATVEVRYWSHDAGGLTARDFESARALDAR